MHGKDFVSKNFWNKAETRKTGQLDFNAVGKLNVESPEPDYLGPSLSLLLDT